MNKNTLLARVKELEKKVLDLEYTAKTHSLLLKHMGRVIDKYSLATATDKNYLSKEVKKEFKYNG